MDKDVVRKKVKKNDPSANLVESNINKRVNFFIKLPLLLY